MDEMFETARKTTEELGKTDDFSDNEKKSLFQMISLGALKYYILKVDPKKNMLFNPEESIDFNGNTGPFIQYTYARIQSVLRKSEKEVDDITQHLDKSSIQLTEGEMQLIQMISGFPHIVAQAGENYSPALIANYCFDLVKEFNHYYQSTPILKRVEPEVANFRLVLSHFTGEIIKKSMRLLGIDVPERM
jgi:arginyl-tRNA synthetase